MNCTWKTGMLRSSGRRAAREIVKVGGSLLAMPEWPDVLAELIRARAALGPTLLVVGGGAIVDGLRAIDALAPQPVAVTHALAIELLGVTARLVAGALGLPVVTAAGGGNVAVLDVARWLADEHRLERLPVGWHVTSDTIACLVAVETPGDLLLAKRVGPPPCPDGDRITPLAERGWVDGHFPVASRNIARIGWAAPASVPMPAVGGSTADGVGAGSW